MGARWIYDPDQNLVLDEDRATVCEARRTKDGPMLASAAEAIEILREMIETWATVTEFPSYS